MPERIVTTGARWSLATLRANLLGLVLLAAVPTILGFLQASAASPLNELLLRCQSQADPLRQLECIQGQSEALVPILLVSLAAVLLQLLASVGVYRASLAATEGTPPDFSMLLAGRFLGQFILVTIAWMVLVVVGLGLCILPGLLALYWLQFAPYFALDRGYGVARALAASFRMVNAHGVPSLGLLGINLLGLLAGSLCFGVATLFTLPFTALLTAYLYRTFNAEAVR